MKVTLIAAIGANNELGKNNQLLWHLPNDLKRFKQITTGHCIIMGRKTFDSLGRALPNRTTIVITRNKLMAVENVVFVEDLKQALLTARKLNEVHCFVIGGAQIYSQALAYADSLDITHVHDSFEADVFFPPIDLKVFQQIKNEVFQKDETNKFNYTISSYEKIHKKVPALFLDRDGVLNKEIGGYITNLEDFEINVAIIPFLKKKQEDGFKLIVITNQGAIDKGLLTHEQLLEINNKMKLAYAESGLFFDEIYYCPHHNEVSVCLCRKPKSLMLQKAIARFNININESMMIGDHERDRFCAEGAGILGIIIPSNEVEVLYS